MLDQQLPHLIDPARLADKHATLKGTLSLAAMPRLREFLADTTGEVSVIMRFGRDENDSTFIQVEINTDLVFKCQRCMENFSYPVSVDVLLSPTMDDTKTSRMHSYEPLIMKDALIAVQDIVEDEILLNLPLIAKHPQDICPVVLSTSHVNRPYTESPFKVLSKLKK